MYRQQPVSSGTDEKRQRHKQHRNTCETMPSKYARHKQRDKQRVSLELTEQLHGDLTIVSAFQCVPLAATFNERLQLKQLFSVTVLYFKFMTEIDCRKINFDVL
jgi:hypothetical protein